MNEGPVSGSRSLHSNRVLAWRTSGAVIGNWRGTARGCVRCWNAVMTWRFVMRGGLGVKASSS